MPGSLNRAMLIGTLGKDPEIRYTQDGTPICNMSIATNESWKDREGNKQSKTEWHRLTVFKKQAEVCGQYLHKGSNIYVEGKMQTRSYEKDGVKKYITDVVVQTFQFLDKRDHSDHQPAYETNAAPHTSAPSNKAPRQSQASMMGYGEPGSDGSDVPF